VMITDHYMGKDGDNGIDLIKWVRQVNEKIEIIFFTCKENVWEEKIVLKAINYGVFWFLFKPDYHLNELIALVERAYNKKVQQEALEIANKRIIEEEKQKIHLISEKEIREKIDKLKTEFIHHINDAFKTPLTPLLSYVDVLLSEYEHDSDLKSMLDIMKMTSKRIDRGIKLLLDLAELESKTYKPSFKEINLVNDILNVIIEEYKTFADENNIKISPFYETYPILKLDEDSIRKVFANLMDNAVKFTSGGTIEVITKESGNADVMVIISDTGIGIPNESRGVVFEPFKKVGPNATKSSGDFGLGLTLVKKYCELNKANIIVEPNEGKGTTIKVILGKESIEESKLPPWN